MALACCVAACLAREAHAQAPAPVPAANPGRPTVSTPATLTPVGYLQFESGLLEARDFGGFSSRFGVNHVVKLTVHRRAQLILQLEPYVRFGSDGGSPDQALGGTAAGAQFLLVDGDARKPAIAVSYVHALSDGRAPDLDIGSSRHAFTVLVSDDLAGLHVDANVMLNQQLDDDRGRAQHGQTLSLSRAFGNFVIASELWHFTQPFGRGDAAGTLWSLSYGARPNLIFDAGFNHGLTDTSTPWEFFAGFTYLLPDRLWGRRQP